MVGGSIVLRPSRRIVRRSMLELSSNTASLPAKVEGSVNVPLRPDSAPTIPGDAAPAPVAARTDDGASPSEADLEAGRLLFARPTRFMLSVADLDQLPQAGPPEIAFAGRSNVGKSSLVNALTGHRAIARTSNTPGRTQQLNFFDQDGRLRLVDLPGYGYAKAPKAQVDAWQRLVFAYLRGRPNLRLVLLLIDGRHGLKKVDEEVMQMLGKAAVPYRVVLTKSDLVGAGELAGRADDIAATLRRMPAAIGEPIATSAARNHGFEELRAVLAAHAESATDAP